jgi:GAF domain-containing protein
MALPLRARGAIIGVLDVQSNQPRAFGSEEAAVLQTLTDQVALAISNARLFEQVQASLDAERRLYSEVSTEAWRKLLSTQTGLSFRRSKQGLDSTGDIWRPEMHVALKTGQTALDQEQPSTLATPIKVRDQVVGVIDARKRDGTGNWTPEQTAVIETLAEQLAVALESARLYQDTQRRAAQERLIGEVTTRIRESLDVETVLKTTASEMRQALDLDNLVIRLATPETDGAKPA